MIGKYSDEMTFDYIMNRMLESVPDTVDKREGSIIYDALSPAAAELVKCYMELDVVMDETFVDTASLQYLMLRCKERGVAIQGETAAVIEGVFTPSSVELTAGLRFNCDEVNYTITEKISAGHYKLEAETLGTVGNKYTGLLLPIQTVNGLDTAQIAAVLIPAEDGDTTDTLREKYYASIDGEAFGGNVADYKEKVNAITGVGGVKVYPVWNGGGTVKLTIIASDFTAPSTELISKVQTAIDPEQNHGEGLGLAPIGHTVTVTGAKYADLTITANVTFAAGWSWGNGKSQLVSAANAYLDELRKTWADSETTVVRISQIETHLLTADCVVDVDGTTVNGDTRNIELAADEIPRLAEIGGAP
ncbi:MAG: baseplate J/gp47 family protein [Agathobaculum butyriciproducens]|nr:baseplate J/gp47 family protein [Agathobaculum butyriciproducens]